MKTRGIDVIEPIVRKIIYNYKNVGCSRGERVLVRTETDLQFTKIRLSSVNAQKN